MCFLYSFSSLQAKIGLVEVSVYQLAGLLLLYLLRMCLVKQRHCCKRPKRNNYCPQLDSAMSALAVADGVQLGVQAVFRAPDRAG